MVVTMGAVGGDCVAHLYRWGYPGRGGAVFPRSGSQDAPVGLWSSWPRVRVWRIFLSIPAPGAIQYGHVHPGRNTRHEHSRYF